MDFFDIIKALFPLVVVVGLLYAVLIFIKRKGITVTGKRSKLVSIDVVSMQAIMPKKYISVVKVEENYLVLGISEHSINLLKELNEDEIHITPQDEVSAEKINFFDALKKNIGMK